VFSFCERPDGFLFSVDDALYHSKDGKEDVKLVSNLNNPLLPILSIHEVDGKIVLGLNGQIQVVG
jgi:hypothetical protein